jgi:hypothetical protein
MRRHARPGRWKSATRRRFPEHERAGAKPRPQLARPEIREAIKLFGLTPPTSLLIKDVQARRRHQTHRGCDAKLSRAVGVIAEAVKDGRAISYREIGRRAGCSRDTVGEWIHRWIEPAGWLVRLDQRGQVLLPEGRLGRLHDPGSARHGWFHTGRYAIRWTDDLIKLWIELDPKWLEALAMAYRLLTWQRPSTRCPKLKSLRAWLVQPCGRTHHLLEDAYQHELEHDLMLRRRAAQARKEAERAAAACQRQQAMYDRRVSAGLAPIAGLIDRARTHFENSDRGGNHPVDPGSKFRERNLDSRKEPLIARARENTSPSPGDLLRLSKASKLVGNSSKALNLLLRVEQAARRVGERFPASVQAQLLRLAERGERGESEFSWWVGEWEACCDSVLEDIAIAHRQGQACPLRSPAAVAWYRSLHGRSQYTAEPSTDTPPPPPEPVRAPKRSDISPVLVGEVIAPPQAPPGWVAADSRILTLQLRLAERGGSPELVAKLRARLKETSPPNERTAP